MSSSNKVLGSVETAVEIEIGHIDELYGTEGLVYARDVLKRLLDDEID